VTNHCPSVSDACYRKTALDLLRCIRPRIRMCAYARISHGSICFIEVKDARRALSDSRFELRHYGSHSQDLEVLPYGKEM
jgi:hypothetical protein